MSSNGIVGPGPHFSSSAKYRYYAALILTLLGVAFHAVSGYVWSIGGNPLNEPLLLKNGELLTKEFKVPISSRYLVFLRIMHSQNRELIHLVGGHYVVKPDGSGVNVPAIRIPMEWNVYREGRRIAGATAGAYNGADFTSDYVGRRLGEFYAERGTYRLSVKVLDDIPELMRADTRVTVEWPNLKDVSGSVLLDLMKVGSLLLWFVLLPTCIALWFMVAMDLVGKVLGKIGKTRP